MNPDKTEANLHRAESSSRREKHRDDPKNFTQARGRLGAAHIRRRVQTDHRSQRTIILKLAESQVPKCNVRHCTQYASFTIGSPTVVDLSEKRRNFGGFLK